MKNKIKKTRLEIRLDKQGEKLRENLKKRKAWQEAHDALQADKETENDSEDKS